ncbi:putative ATP-dependent RNA helicase TDRD12 [Nephila pilipes]|uniref:Probable ATP-dependent RNA helicase spindle-E n=1 Tax=Nephila pilipes TaxID=299642 RepID=A0A8X6PC39_NEPPI|nr:putative ATP-dependent RNA helicase TDRD12 [Nephila pilipes]
MKQHATKGDKGFMLFYANEINQPIKEMIWKSNEIPLQFLQNEDISITIIEVKDPAHFIIKESPSVKSSYSSEFLKLEDALQKYCDNIEQGFFQLPVKDTLVIAHYENKYYRARVCSILNMTQGYIIKVYLVDYGMECRVARPCLYEIPEDFLKLPFQAVDFRLDLEPISLVMDPCEMSVDYGPVAQWDVSALTFIEDMRKAMKNIYVKVKDARQGYVIGTMHVFLQNGEIKCINDELVLRKFAQARSDCMNDKILPSAAAVSFQKEKSIPNSLQSPAIAALTSKPAQNENISSTQKLRALLKKRFKEQNNASTSSADTEGTVNLKSDAKDLSLEITNDEKSKFEENVSKQELHENVELKHSEDTLDSNRVLESIACKPINDLISSRDSAVLSNTNDISENDAMEALKKKDQCEESPAKLKGVYYIKRRIQQQKERIAKYSAQLGKDASMDLPPKLDDSSCFSSIQNIPEQTNSSCTKINSSELQEQSENSSLHCDSSVMSIKSDTVQNVLSSETDLNQSMESKLLSATAAHKTQKSEECFQQRATMEKFCQMYRKNRLNFSAKLKEDSSSEADQSPEKSIEIAKSKNEVESLISEKNESETEKASCTVNNTEQDILDSDFFEINDSSSESQLNSRKSSFNTESEVELPFHSEEYENTKPINFGNEIFLENQIPALCFGKSAPEPILSMNCIPFSPTLEKTLRDLNFNGPSSIQSAVWPAALRNRSIAAIAPPHSGKTVAYLLPIVSNFLNEMYNELPHAKGPVAIIICSSWKKVVAVLDFLHLFLNGFKLRILTYFADGRSKRKRVMALMNGCDILISVPSILLNFLKEDLICIKRCCHFILDDGTNLFADHIKEVKEIIKIFSEKAKSVNEHQIPLQVVINSERWNNTIASFVEKCMKNPIVLFTSYLEAAIYTKIPIFAHICKESEKNNRLLSLVKACEEKTIVCTSDLITAKDIHSFLKSENVRSYLITEEMTHYISRGIIQDWKSVSSHLPYCLISTDSALTGINISEAKYIIHYDIPEISRLQFGYRFRCMTKHLIEQDASNCGAHILLSETCYPKAEAILKIIKRTGKEISMELTDLVKKQEKMLCSPDVPLCHYFKAFGLCKLPICTKRHYISSVNDKPNMVPNEGDVHAIVTHVFDASHFYVKILKYLPPNGEKLLSLSCEYTKLYLNLKKFYSVESNRKLVKFPIIGGNYIFRDSSKLAYRVKVLDLSSTSGTGDQKINLLYRDDGCIRSYEKWELFEDIDFGCLPSPHAVEVYLCNVRTPDACQDWNSQANLFAKELVLNKEVHGKIVLCLGDTLWLHPFALREKLNFIDDYLNILSVEKALMKADFALESKKHIQILKNACKNKIILPKIKKTNLPSENETNLKPRISYAFLELNTYEDVYVSSVISPQQVYVQRVKFVECLEELLEKINDRVTAGKLNKCSALVNGMHCIAPFEEDNKYYRAIVMDVSSDSDGVQLFFVDFGDSCHSPKDSIFDLPVEFTLLPFQAIECELNGICAPHGGWSDKGVDFLSDITKDEEGCMKILEIKAYTKLICYDAGNRYKVDIWNGEKTLSEQLLKEGLVDEGEKYVPADTSAKPVEEAFYDDIPDGYVDSVSDDDMPVDNKDNHGLFCIALAKMMLKENSEAIDEIMRNMSGEEEQKGKGCNAVEISSNILEEENVLMDEKNAVVLKSPVLALQRLLNHMNQQSKIKLFKPKILWWDSLEHVNILVKLPDVQIYELDVQDHLFSFKTSLRGSDYFIEEEFYSLVYSEDFVTKNGIEGLSLILKKRESVRWPRLTKQNIKVRNIKYDLEHIDDSDSEDFLQENIQVPTKENCSSTDKEEIGMHDSASDEDSEEDALPWQKIAEFKDPYAISLE